MTPVEMRQYVEQAPLPGDGPGPWQAGAKMGGYDGCGRSLAHALLVIAEDNPALLVVPNRDDDPTGIERANNDKLWEAFKTRWPDGNEWLGGPTGFQFGWAHNAVRYILDAEPVGNPAVITLAERE